MQFVTIRPSKYYQVGVFGLGVLDHLVIVSALLMCRNWVSTGFIYDPFRLNLSYFTVFLRILTSFSSNFQPPVTFFLKMAFLAQKTRNEMQIAPKSLTDTEIAFCKYKNWNLLTRNQITRPVSSSAADYISWVRFLCSCARKQKCHWGLSNHNCGTHHEYVFAILCRILCVCVVLNVRAVIILSL